MIPFLIKSALSMAVLLAVYYLFLEREKMHRFNRFYLLLSLVFALAIPFVNIPVYVAAEAVPQSTPAPVVPQAVFQESVTISDNQPAATVSVAPKPEPQTDYRPYIAWGLYAAITLILAIRFMLNIFRFYRIKSKSETQLYKGATLVLLTKDVLPHTFLNNIYINKTHYENRCIEPELFTHELTHVRQWHTADILFIELLKIIFWFNPLLYVYKKAIQMNHEFLADQTTINQHLNIITYQKLLLDKAIPATAYTLASSINFSVTKKRFIMMTKTTTKTRGMLLKLTVLPVIALIVCFLSIHTIAYAKAPNGAKTNLVTTAAPIEGFIPHITLAAAEDTLITEGLVPIQVADTVKGDARRDEYFKGVRIVIDDKKRSVSENVPYEELALKHKRYYLNDIPEKKRGKPISEEDYKFDLEQKDATYYVDEKEVSREEVLKYKREDFVYTGFKMRGESKPGGEMVQHIKIILFTRPMFDKKLKHVNDHYPDNTYVINVTDKPVDTNKEDIEKLNAKDASGKSYKEREDEKAAVHLTEINYTEDMIAANKNVSPQFTGGKFEDYFYKNLKVPAGESRKNMYLFFTINTDGSVSDVMFTEENEALKKEITRVLLSSPAWIPAQHDGKAEKVTTSIKANF